MSNESTSTAAQRWRLTFSRKSKPTDVDCARVHALEKQRTYSHRTPAFEGGVKIKHNLHPRATHRQPLPPQGTCCLSLRRCAPACARRMPISSRHVQGRNKKQNDCVNGVYRVAAKARVIFKLLELAPLRQYTRAVSRCNRTHPHNTSTQLDVGGGLPLAMQCTYTFANSTLHVQQVYLRRRSVY